MTTIYDVAIIGGGINGCGCAADAALRGLSVFLCDQDDLASKTSSASTKLIHGGLRYLESYNFTLVKKALYERQLLLNLAPYLVHPQAFVLPHQPFMRSDWFLRTGLFIYDHLSRKNTLPNSKKIFRHKANPFYFSSLKKTISKGFIFYDAITDDARLTLANALQARNHNATIRPNTALINAQVHKGVWRLELQPKQGSSYTLLAKALINATGPWVNIIAEKLKTPIHQEITWVKGSHIVLPALYPENHAYLLQHSDNRVIFVIPYHGYSMIGTTDVAYEGSLEKVTIDEQEIDYLCNLVNSYFDKPISKEHIVQSWSGIRPLLADAEVPLTSLSRDYKHWYSTIPAPIVTIYGGKITTYRKLAAEVIDSLRPALGNYPLSRTEFTPLPGSQTADNIAYEEYCLIAKKEFDWLENTLLDRYLLTYGTNTQDLLKNCHNHHDLGLYFGNSLFQKEVEYLINYEWATTMEDILWRRTKLGLDMDNAGEKALENFLRTYLACNSS